MPAPHDVDSVWLERVTEFVPEDVVAVVEPRRPDVDGSDDWIDGVQRVGGPRLPPEAALRRRPGRRVPRGHRRVAGSSRWSRRRAGRSPRASGCSRPRRHTDPATGFAHHGWLNLLVAVTRALQSVPEASSETDPADLVDAVRDALDATDAAALARESPTSTRPPAAACGPTSRRSAPPPRADQGAEMARLGLV